MATENELNLVTDPYLFLICGPLGAKASNQLENNPVTYQKENYLYLFTQAPTNICPLPRRCQPRGSERRPCDCRRKGQADPSPHAGSVACGRGRTRGQRGPPPTLPLHPVASSTSPRRGSSPEVQPRACDPGVTSAWPDHSAAWPHSRAGQILRMFPGQTLWVTLCTRGQRRAGVWGRKAGRGDRAGPPSRPHTMGGLAGSATPHSPGVPMARSARWPWPVSRTRRPKSQVLCSLSPPPKLNSGDSRWFR